MVAKLITSAVVCSCLAGTIALAQRGRTQEQQSGTEKTKTEENNVATDITPEDSTATPSSKAKLNTLKEQRIEICKLYVDAMEAMFEVGQISVHEKEQAAEELFEAELDMASGPRVAILYRRELERLSRVRNATQQRVDIGRESPRELLEVKLRRIKLEIELAKLEAASE